jgi:hypothetical protein
MAGAQLISRNGNPFASFADLGERIAASLPNLKQAVLDGEIVCIDKKGKAAVQGFAFPPRFCSSGSRGRFSEPEHSWEVACYDELAAKTWALNSAVECHLHTVEVRGSNPLAPTIQFNNLGLGSSCASTK